MPWHRYAHSGHAFPLLGVPVICHLLSGPSLAAVSPATDPALGSAAEVRVALRSQRLGIADVEHLDAIRVGDRARVYRLSMRIPRSALIGFLADTIAGGPVQRLAVKPLGPNRLLLEALAFGLPTQATLGLLAAGGRALLEIETVRLGWFPVSGRFLRDQILTSSDPELIRNGDVRPAGTSGLSFSPDYLFSHVMARLPFELAAVGLGPHLDVRLTRIALQGTYVRVEGGQ